MVLAAMIVIFGLGLRPAQAADGYRLLRLNGHTVKWGPATLGEPAIVTYALAGGRLVHPGVRNCRHAGSIVPLLHKSALNRTTFMTALEKAFAMWEGAANIRFRAVKRSETPDILIAAEGEPDGIAYTDVALDGAIQGATTTLKAGMICLNPALKWTAGDSADLPGIGKTYGLTYTLAHEIGHAIGLDHPGPEGELMSFRFDGIAKGLKAGDRRGAIALYGANPPPAAVAMVQNGSSAP